MSHPLIDRNEPLRRLRDEGYELEVTSGYVLVHVPYVDSSANIRYGILAYAYTASGFALAPPQDHTALWCGQPPCHRDGREMVGIKASDVNTQVRQGLVATINLSNKPRVDGGNYVEPDLYAKFKRYIGLICPAAESLDPAIRAASFKPVATTDEDSPFQYTDTASSRAGISAVSEKLKPLRIAIIGLGGTGSYVLDLVAKTPVKEIRIFDDDPFYSHNAFRAPGAASFEELEQRPTKTAYFAARYSNMHRHITPNVVRIGDENAHLLDGIDFAFVCVDDGDARRSIMEQLLARNIAFVDVGLGVKLVAGENSLVGTVRLTTGTATKSDHLLGGKRVPIAPRGPDDDYRHNIQIADLNALNAVLAVIRWKKLFGVYQDQEHEHHSTYTVNCNLLTSDEHANAT